MRSRSSHARLRPGQQRQPQQQRRQYLSGPVPVHVDRPRHRPSLFLRSFSSWNLARSNAPGSSGTRRIHASTACCSSRWRGWCRHCLARACHPVALALTCLLHRLLHALALLLIGLGLRLGILHLWWRLLSIAATLAGLRRRLRVSSPALGCPAGPDCG
jgi:hypothetical protein